MFDRVEEQARRPERDSVSLPVVGKRSLVNHDPPASTVENVERDTPVEGPGVQRVRELLARGTRTLRDVQAVIDAHPGEHLAIARVLGERGRAGRRDAPAEHSLSAPGRAPGTSRPRSDPRHTADSPRNERGLTPIGERIVERLEREHAGRRGKTWDVSQGNQLEGDWIVDSPRTWTRQAPEGTDFLYDELYRSITAARHGVTFATLAPPSERYVAVMRRALKDLAAAQPERGGGIDIRILIGQGEPEALRDQLVGGLTETEQRRVRISVGTYGLVSFSHAKIVSTDGNAALVGGHNWWDNEYNVENPVHDVSMRLRGPAARHAESYFDQLWQYALAEGTVAGSAAIDATPAPSVSDETSTAAKPLPSRTERGSTVISVGTLGGASVTADATSDSAIYAMLDGAQTSVRLSQQDLISMNLRFTRAQLQEKLKVPGWALPDEIQLPQHFARPLLDALARALLRGVKVEIAISSGGEGGYSNGTPEQIRDAIVAHLDEMAERPWWAPWSQPRSGAELAAARSNLTVLGVRNEDGEQARNHAKIAIVDDTTFYVGSQNLYPGGMAEPTGMQLAEFGFIVDDPEKARELVERYWNPLWRHARPSNSPAPERRGSAARTP